MLNMSVGTNVVRIFQNTYSSITVRPPQGLQDPLAFPGAAPLTGPPSLSSSPFSASTNTTLSLPSLICCYMLKQWIHQIKTCCQGCLVALKQFPTCTGSYFSLPEKHEALLSCPLPHFPLDTCGGRAPTADSPFPTPQKPFSGPWPSRTLKNCCPSQAWPLSCANCPVLTTKYFIHEFWIIHCVCAEPL